MALFFSILDSNKVPKIAGCTLDQRSDAADSNNWISSSLREIGSTEENIPPLK